MLLDGLDDSQLSGDSKWSPATVNFSAKAKDERKQSARKSLEDINFIDLNLYFLVLESTDNRRSLRFCGNMNEAAESSKKDSSRRKRRCIVNDLIQC